MFKQLLGSSKNERQHPQGNSLLSTRVSLFPGGGGRWRDCKTSRCTYVNFVYQSYFIDNAKVVNEANANDCDALLFAQHAAGDQGNRHSYAAPAYVE